MVKVHFNGVSRIALERDRQISDEGYTPEGDRGKAAELLRASFAYTQNSILVIENPYQAPELRGHPADFGVWPANWPRDAWKPTGDPRRDLEKAGALIAAALDALDLE